MLRPSAIFGYSPDPSFTLRTEKQVGELQRTLDYGTAGRLLLRCTGGQIAESETTLILQFGHLRRADGSPIGPRELCRAQLVTPTTVCAQELRGSAWVAAFSKHEPQFLVYQTLMALPQLYFARVGEAIVGASDLRSVLAGLPTVELDPEALPMHFLFRLVPGNRTYFRGVSRLFPGQALCWRAPDLCLRQVRDLRCRPEDPAFVRVDGPATAWLDQRLSAVMSGYTQTWTAAGKELTNLLSGGEDSSLLQLWLKDHQPNAAPPASYSFAVLTAAFHFETEYAAAASQALGTVHTFCPIAPEEYPQWLEQAIEALHQPTLFNEGVPCFLALAKFLRERGEERRVFVAGQAADALHGVVDLPAVVWFELARAVPGAHLLLRGWGALRAQLGRSTGLLFTEAAQLLAAAKRTNPLLSPQNYIALAGELDLALRCFGEQAVRRAFAERRALECDLVASDSLCAQVQAIDFVTAGYDPGVVAAQLFAAQGLELVQFYLDEDVVRATMAISAKQRFFTRRFGRLKLKPLQKALLRQRSCGQLADKKKGGTAFTADLGAWLRHGVLKEHVEAIERPDFVPRTLLTELKKQPKDFLWNLLIYDLFRKRVLARYPSP